LYGKEKNIVMKKRGLRGEDMILGRIYTLLDAKVNIFKNVYTIQK